MSTALHRLSQGSDEELDAEITRDFHFGGGLLSAKRRDEEEPEGADGDVGELPKKKTKKEARSSQMTFQRSHGAAHLTCDVPAPATRSQVALIAHQLLGRY